MSKIEQALLCFERQCASGIATEADLVVLAVLREQANWKDRALKAESMLAERDRECGAQYELLAEKHQLLAERKTEIERLRTALKEIANSSWEPARKQAETALGKRCEH